MSLVWWCQQPSGIEQYYSSSLPEVLAIAKIRSSCKKEARNCMERKTFPMERQKRIALLAHDNTKT
ncbi:MAG: hypothetical protein LC740_08405, partial [Actinobacteria bacterium]|nr:hypothetical protein [Actinomycetota bacterium]